MADYLLTQAGDTAEVQRLKALARYHDPATTRVLEALGVSAGWRCADIGAGGGSITRWLAERVGTSGAVLATDLDVTLLRAIAGGTVEVRAHDIRTDPLPTSAFDLTHARLLLSHLPERHGVLAKLVDTTKPGGWVVVGDIDFTSVRSRGPDAEFTRVTTAFETLTGEAGWQAGMGAQLPRMLERAGLHNVEAHGWQSYQHGNREMPALLSATYTRLADRLSRYADPGEVERVIARLGEPRCAFFGPTVWTAWGRRPAL